MQVEEKTFIGKRIDWLMNLRKKSGFKGFWSIRRESAEWGYNLALADVCQHMLDDLSEEEKNMDVIKRLYKWVSTVK